MTTTELPLDFEETDFEGGSFKHFVIDGELGMRIRYALNIDEDDAEVEVLEHLRLEDDGSTERLFSNLIIRCDGLRKEFADTDSYGSSYLGNTLVRLLAWLDAEAPL